MMNTSYKLLAGLFFLLIIPVFPVLAQTSSVSPYSRFGVGDLLFSGYANQRGAGGTSIAGVSPTRLNFNNPASYAYDTIMVVDFGMDAEFSKQQQGGFSNVQANSSVTNFSIGFPLVRGKWAMAFGFIPYSGVGYEIRTVRKLDSTNTATSSYTGKGGYTRYYIGTGLKITPQLSAGVNASYLNGNINRTGRILFSDQKFFSNRYQDDLGVSDVYLEFGLHWKGKLDAKRDLSIGVTGAPSQKIDARKTTLWENYLQNEFTLIETVRDTILYSPEVKGQVTLPTRLGLGFQVNQGSKWTLGLDFNYQDWSEFQSFGKTDSLKSSFRISAGGQLIPDNTSLSYLQRIQYRGGLYFNRTFLELNNTPLNDMGISAGFGLPFRKAYGSMLNFAVEVGQKGTTAENLVREQYVRIAFGITLNEDWFRKRKFD